MAKVMIGSASSGALGARHASAAFGSAVETARDRSVAGQPHTLQDMPPAGSVRAAGRAATGAGSGPAEGALAVRMVRAEPLSVAGRTGAGQKLHSSFSREKSRITVSRKPMRALPPVH